MLKIDFEKSDFDQVPGAAMSINIIQIDFGKVQDFWEGSKNLVQSSSRFGHY